MERIKVKSSNLSSVGYDPETETMEIEFTNGRIYRYEKVPEWIYRDLIDPKLPISKGHYFATAIKKNYQFKEVT